MREGWVVREGGEGEWKSERIVGEGGVKKKEGRVSNGGRPGCDESRMKVKSAV